MKASETTSMIELKNEEAAYQHTLPNVYTESVTAITMLTIILISIVYQFIISLDIGCLYKIYSVYRLCPPQDYITKRCNCKCDGSER